MAFISFSSLLNTDFPLLHKWINAPHVWKWWGENRDWSLQDIETKYETYVLGYKVLKDIKAPIHGFIIHINNTPIGYIQYYNAYDFPREQGYQLENLSNSLASIDLYIGESDFTGKGFGPLIINQFLNAYVWKNFNACFVDPDVNNIAAIRAYEKAGFKGIQEEANSLFMLRFSKKEI